MTKRGPGFIAERHARKIRGFYTRPRRMTSASIAANRTNKYRIENPNKAIAALRRADSSPSRTR